MAKKPPKVEVEEETPASKQKAGFKKILEECRENFKLDLEADKPNRDKYSQCMKFCYEPGAQWEDAVKTARGKKRITREFNETRVKVKSVVNHIRANRPAAKITPVEESDIDTAEAMQGIWLNILNTSNMDDVTDFAAETQVAAGMGAWYVDTEYCDDSVDQQDIRIRAIRNPLCLVPDRAAKEQDKSDARHWNYFTSLSKAAYEEKYGSAEKVASFEHEEFTQEDNPNTDDDTIWLSAYWRKEPMTRTIVLLATGETVDKESVVQGAVIVKERKIKTHKIVQYICSATEIIERNEWAGKHFPFVVAYGEYVIIDGKTRWNGMVMNMMDAARSHNEMMTGVVETIAMAPQAKYFMTAVQAKDLMGQIQTAVDENLPVILYHNDPAAPGPPQRVGAADVPAALMQAAQMSRDSLNSVSSVPDANVGLTSNESSGKAIRARQDSGLVGTYNYGDNISKAIGRTCAIVLDLVPKIIDTERSFRILGKEGAEKYIKVNRRDPVTGAIVENDLTRGKFDFVVTQGPNIQTQRQEATEFYQAMSQSNPALQQVAGDVIFENADVPGAKQVAERLKAILPPQIQALLNKDQPEDPRVIAAMQALQQQEAALQEQAQIIDQAKGEAVADKAAADKAKSDVDIALAKLDTKSANIATQIAQFQALVANTQAKFAGDDAADTEKRTAEKVTQAEGVEAEAEGTLSAVGEALAAMQQQSAEQTEALAMLMQELAAQQKPKTPKVMTTQRVNGGFETVITDEATGETQVAKSQRVNGQMVTRVEPTGTVQ